jgi:outer membrane protein insertion porin family/translocation and assembly module TamA
VPRRWFRVGLTTALALGAGCRSLPPQPVVDEVRIEGLARVEEKPLLDGLSTSETPLLFGLIPGVLEYTTYDPNVLSRDLERIERYLRARGHYEAKVWAARVIRTGPHEVKVEIHVHEGPEVRVSRIDPGVSRLPFDVMLLVNRARRMADGDVFDEEEFEKDKERIAGVLAEAGYAFAKVDATATVDVAARTAHVRYTIDLGPKARYGPIRFVGLEKIPEDGVRNQLDLEEGEIYNSAELAEAEQALISLGVFSNVEIRPDRSHPETGLVPIQVWVREGTLANLRIGGGSRFDVLRLSGHLMTGWEHRNFLGGIRHFRVEGRPGVTLFPTRIDHLEPWTAYLPEFRSQVTLSQPSFLEARTTGIISAEYNVYPLLYPLPDGVDPEAERVIGYQEVRASAGVERSFFNYRVNLAPSYNWQANFPFTYQGGRPNGLEAVRVSFPELVATLDLRDDAMETHRGIYLTNSLQVAGHGLGGTVSDVRVKPEIRAYLPLRRAVLATRLTFGFLFPGNYGDTLDPDSSESRSAELDPSDPAVVADQHKLLFRAFYSGGPNSNRGYPFRGVGPHGPVGFLVPTGLDCSLEQRSVEDLPNGCIRPLGGLTLWEASLEVRIPFPIDAPFYGVTFIDASDLTRSVGKLRLDVPHLTAGGGIRYITPLGAIRFDVGYRVQGAQALGKKELPSEEGRPGGNVLGLFPGAVHLAIGEAF